MNIESVQRSGTPSAEGGEMTADIAAMLRAMEELTEINRRQAGIIDDLFNVLAQHKEVDSLDARLLEDIRETARLSKQYEEEGVI